MGGQHHLTNTMESMAANIAIQLLEQGNKTPKSPKMLDLKIEQALMCSVFGIVECTNTRLMEEFRSHVNLNNGCTELKTKYDSQRMDKRNDQRIGKYIYFYFYLFHARIYLV